MNEVVRSPALHLLQRVAGPEEARAPDFRAVDAAATVRIEPFGAFERRHLTVCDQTHLLAPANRAVQPCLAADAAAAARFDDFFSEAHLGRNRAAVADVGVILDADGGVEGQAVVRVARHAAGTERRVARQL